MNSVKILHAVRSAITAIAELLVIIIIIIVVVVVVVVVVYVIVYFNDLFISQLLHFNFLVKVNWSHSTVGDGFKIFAT